MDPTTWTIIGTLASTVAVLAGVVFKLQADRVTTLERLVDKLGDQNDDLRDRLGKELSVDTLHSDLLNRILIIVESIRYDGQTARERQRHSTSRGPEGPDRG